MLHMIDEPFCLCAVQKKGKQMPISTPPSEHKLIHSHCKLKKNAVKSHQENFCFSRLHGSVMSLTLYLLFLRSNCNYDTIV